MNNTVYIGLMAKNQEEYLTTVNKLFDFLDSVEERLSKQRYLMGNQLTVADIRMYTTLVRFDIVYHHAFMCNKKMISRDYPNIWGFTRDIYNTGDIKETVDFFQIRTGYYLSHASADSGPLGPNGIIPIGPVLDYDEPHGREKFQ